MWDLRPIHVRSIENVSDQFFKTAVEHEEFIIGQERDPNLITRAVTYLAHTYAIPPMRDDTHWSQDMLRRFLNKNILHHSAEAGRLSIAPWGNTGWRSTRLSIACMAFWRSARPF
jgi:hypothetical protein